MSGEQAEQRLTAILVAEVAGYSQLMGADAEGTRVRLEALRTELIDPCIAEHHGHIVATRGGGLLVDFASVVDAVRCASAWQKGVAARYLGATDDDRIEFRIAINLGEIIVGKANAFSDGVNPTACCQVLAEPGAIYISSAVYEHVRDKLDFVFEAQASGYSC